MKKQIALLLTLAAFLISACDDENPVRPVPAYKPQLQTQPRPEPLIRSIYPSAGPSGSIVAILGENFSLAISDNYVTFGSSNAEVTYVGYGVITVRVPNLIDGDYEINVNTGGQVRRVPQMFSIINSQH
jgi:hypothetical protein